MTPNCTYYQRNICRSCDYLDRSYENGLKLKVKVLAELFPDDQGSIDSMAVSRNVFTSRNKAKMAVTGSLEDPIIGLTEKKGKELCVVELLECPLHLEAINRLLTEIKRLIPLYRLHPYDLNSRKGELKFIIIHQSESTGEMLLRFVLRSREAEGRIRRMLPELTNLFPSLKVVTINIQPIHQAVLEGPEEIVLTPASFISHQMGPFELILPFKSFFQTNSQVALELYQYVGDWVRKLSPSAALDLYCGVGGFSFFASPWCQQILGVEISSEAVMGAKLAKERNGTANVEFYSASVDELMDRRYLDSLVSPIFMDSLELVIVNPPRSGLSERTMDFIRDIRPRHLIYSSCNPLTLQRDVARLKDDYHILTIRPFDMFPLTKHFEVVVVLERSEG